MRLNHLDLHSPVVTETATFFIEHLGFTLVETRGKDAFIAWQTMPAWCW